MTSPYRRTGEIAERERPPPSLVYVTGEAGRTVGPARSALQLGAVGVTAATIASAAGLPQLGAGFLVGTMVLAVWRWRRGEGDGLVLEVDGGELSVTDRRRRTVLAHIRLSELRDVSLDTKSIRKVEPGHDVPAVQFVTSQIGPEIDVARIVLEITGRAPIRLTDAFLAHTDSVEWIARIRVFLRSHGWLPADERERLPDAGD